METTYKLKTFVLSILLIAGLSAADTAIADDTFEERLTVSEPLVLDVETGSGSIEVRSGSNDEVTVTGEIHVQRRFLWGKPRNADELIQEIKDNPPIELNDGRLRISQVKKRKLRNSISISYEIVVPSGTEVFAESGSGSILIADIAAPVDAHAGSGRVVLNNIAGPAKAQTGSGAIRAENVSGEFNGKSGSGSIHLEQTGPGNVVVSTGSGSSKLTGIVGSVRASAGSGRITIEGRQEGEWKVDTGSGSVYVSLPQDAAFELDAETGSGGINVDHPLTLEGRISKKRVVGTVRGGGPLLRIDTGSGGIRVN